MKFNFKKILSFVLCLTFVLSALTVVPVSAAWYDEYINFVYVRGIMDGKNGGRLIPQETTTRGECVLALYNMAGRPKIFKKSTFSDVSTTSKYSRAISWAESNSIASGTGDGAFSPDAPLTREMAMTFLFRAFPKIGIEPYIPPISVLSRFTDKDLVSDWALQAMNTLINMGIVSGNDKGELTPQKNLTNAEVSAIICRSLEIFEKQGGTTKFEIQEDRISEESIAASAIEAQKEILLEKFQSGEISQETYDDQLAALGGAIDANTMLSGSGGDGDDADAETDSMTAEQAKEKLDEMLENGELSQEEYTEAYAEVEAGTIPAVLSQS